ncbi:MAG TPA: hypothetical protein VIG99_16800 [Myxococcaceae bacterium]
MNELEPRRCTCLILTLAALIASASGCGQQGPLVEKRFVANGAWAADGSAALLVESRYQTRTPGRPYFSDQDSFDWEFAFLQADPSSLQGRTELAHFPDPQTYPGPARQIQYSPIYWDRAGGKVLSGHTVFDLQTGSSTALWLPRSTALALFGSIPGASQTEHPEEGFIDSSLLSPDGTKVGIYYELVEPSRSTRAIAFFSVDGTFLASTALQAADRLDPPPAGDVPVRVHFLWTKDSTGAVVIHIERDAQGNLLPASHADRIAAANAAISQVTMVPARAVPTRGGPISGDGKYLLQVNDDVTTGRLPNWIAFENLTDVTLDGVDYIY